MSSTGRMKSSAFLGLFLETWKTCYQFSGSKRIWLHALKHPQAANFVHVEMGEGKKEMVSISERLVALRCMG